MKQTFSVKAILRRDKKKSNGTCPVYYQVIVDSKPLKLPSGQSLFEKDWNFEKGLEKGSKSSHLNCMIKKDVSRLDDFLIERRSSGKFISLDIVKAFYNNETLGEDFYNFFDSYCKIKFVELSSGTQYHYELLRKRLKEFKPKLRLSEINLNFIERFDNFLKVEKETGVEGVATKHKKLKAVIRSAFKKRLIEFNPYDDFKIVKGKAKSVSLSIDDVIAIRDLDLSQHSRLELTRDLFLFGCYTGLRNGDISKLKNIDIVNDEYILTEMSKTKNNVEIPLFNRALSILKKYRMPGVDVVFPYRTNQCMNRDLKIIGKMCKIKKNITFHVSRHTYGTIIANSGLSLFDVARLLGHRNVNQSMIYVNTGMNQIVSKLGEVDVFN